MESKSPFFCPDEKHVPRDNDFGVTWCIRCGRLFNKPCGKPLKKDLKAEQVMSNLTRQSTETPIDLTDLINQ